ncbi:MAG: tol-pal system protein YbgF [Woeseiaceae bacterium]
MLRHLTICAISLLLAAGCATTPQADDPVMVKLNELERRLGAIERILASGSLVELTVQADELQRRTGELQGQADTLAHDAAEAAERQRELYADLDMRIQALERVTRGSAPVSVLDGGSLAPGQLPVPGGSDRDNYQAAFELLKEQRYEPAAMAFQQFLVSYPDSQLADNAQYWLAESYYVTQQYDVALGEFEKVINEYPTSRKVPDALLKVGYCNYELERWNESRRALVRVQGDYSGTTAARLAEQRLKRMDTEGQ